MKSTISWYLSAIAVLFATSIGCGGADERQKLAHDSSAVLSGCSGWEHGGGTYLNTFAPPGSTSVVAYWDGGSMGIECAPYYDSLYCADGTYAPNHPRTGQSVRFVFWNQSSWLGSCDTTIIAW
jgi:hypothetical protein